MKALTLTHTPAACRQRGTILFVSLVILLLLTIIGVSGMRNITMEERMAGNLRDGELALQAAEAALRTGENWLAPLTGEPAACATIGSPCTTVWAEGVLPDLSYQVDAWWIANARTYTNTGGGSYLTGGDTGDNGPHANNSYVSQPPQFIIQQQKFVRDSFVVGHSSRQQGDIYYRVTAHGYGGSVHAESVLQSSFTKRF